MESNYSARLAVRSLAKSFRFAWDGITYGIKTQRNMRVHYTVLCYMLFFLLRYGFWEVSRAEWAALLIASAMVIGTEYLNTAVESIVDLVSPQYQKLAGIAKDTSSAAVLVFAVASVGVGISILFQPEAFRQLFGFYKTHITELVAVLITIIFALSFIFTGTFWFKPSKAVLAAQEKKVIEEDQFE